MKTLIEIVNHELLPNLIIESIHPHDPVVVHRLPDPWKLLGVGNYAAVLHHPQYPKVVVKIYAPGRPGYQEEVQVYEQLGQHPSYSECYHFEKNYLILKRIIGITLYDCVHRGIRIPELIIHDIDKALQYAKSKGLHPHDVHGKNVMLSEGRGVLVDVSDFYKREYCNKWKDLKKAYYRVYLPYLYRYPVPIPYLILNGVRKSYRFYRKYFPSYKKQREES